MNYMVHNNVNNSFSDTKMQEDAYLLASKNTHDTIRKRKKVVLLSTHFINDFILSKYQRLRRELQGNEYDVILLVNKTHELDYTTPEDVSCFFTDCDSLNALGYEPIEETLIPGSCHFPVFRFFLDHPYYDYYWLVEYDVEYTGNWSELMIDCDTNLQDYAFITCHVEKFDQQKNGNWVWWYNSNHLGLKPDACVKGFNPICRFSNKALEYLDEIQKSGASAHSEVIITTSLYQSGYKIGDIGGQGDFVPDGYKDKYYLAKPGSCNDGTMRYRPIYKSEDILGYGLVNKLYHPVKE